MRLYVKKTGEKSFLVYKEKTWQSLASDLMTIFTAFFLVGLDALFSIYIGRAVAIDIMVCVLFILYISTAFKNKKTETTRRELEKIIKEL